MRARRAWLGVAVLLVALPAGGAVALAQGTSSPGVATADAVGDVRRFPDIVRFSLTRGADGRLHAAIRLAADWNGADLLARRGPPGSLCVRLWTTTSAPDEPPTYLVCATAAAGGGLRGSVLRERPNALPARVGTAVVRRPSRRTVTLRFAQSAIGRPGILEAAAEATRPGCAAASCVDVAPEGGQALLLTLRRAGGSPSGGAPGG